MGINDAAAARLNEALLSQERNYAWLARATGIPYKRLLAEMKHRTKRLDLETSITVAEALDLDLASLVADATQVAA